MRLSSRTRTIQPRGDDTQLSNSCARRSGPHIAPGLCIGRWIAPFRHDQSRTRRSASLQRVEEILARTRRSASLQRVEEILEGHAPSWPVSKRPRRSRSVRDIHVPRHPTPCPRLTPVPAYHRLAYCTAQTGRGRGATTQSGAVAAVRIASSLQPSTPQAG